MAAPNMATLTASLERSLRNCSLNHTAAGGGAVAGLSRSSSSSDAPDLDDPRLGRFPPCQLDLSSYNSSSSSSSETTTLVDLNSHVSLPYHWEQCLDLQTGEIYYKNWRNGMKAKEDPRLFTASTYYFTEEDEEDDEEEDDDEDSSYDSEGSSTSPPSSSYRGLLQSRRNAHTEDVLVVAGCKSCLMYYMVPKQVVQCPKCTGQLLHFDRPDRD